MYQNYVFSGGLSTYILIIFISLNAFAEKSDDFFKGNFKFQSTSYTTPILNQPELNNSYQYSLDLSGKWSSNILEGQGQILGGHYSEINNSYLILPELFVSTDILNKNSKIIIGRHIQSWSLLDEEWKLSLWEPKFNIDVLQPVREGLTGVTWDYDYEIYHFGLFYSTFFMPNMGAHIVAKDGNLDIHNRWISNPKGEFPLQGKSTQILYSLDVPSIAKIVNQKSYAVFSKFGSEDFGPSVSMSWGYKPMNDLALGYKGLLRIDDRGTFGDVTILPHVIYHEISGVDFGYKWQNSKISISNLKDLPNNLVVENGWNMQQLEGINAWSARYDMYLKSILNLDGALGVSRLIIKGAHITELDSENNLGTVLDGFRVPFTNAWALDYKGAFLGFKKSFLTSEIRFVRDILQEGSMMNAEIQMHPTKLWNFLFGADIIGVSNSSEDNNAKTFLNQYRANDRIYAGAAYVF